MPMIAGSRGDRPNQLQMSTPAFSALINGAANTRRCDRARGNELKVIRSRFPASVKGGAGDALEILRCCDVRGCAGGAVAATLAASAAERAAAGGAQWPNVALDEPQWPNLRLDDIEAPRLNKRPSFVDPQEVEDRIMGRKPRPATKSSAVSKPDLQPERNSAISGLDVTASVGAARWPTLSPEKPVSPFAFEVGGRYWYSSGRLDFGFTNGSPLFGNPTSTLDWRGLSAHSGEVFARIDHIPSGVFVKGLVGLGITKDGHIDDLDFLVTQFKFSDTTSDVTTAI